MTTSIDYDCLAAQLVLRAGKDGTFKVVLYVAQHGEEGVRGLGLRQLAPKVCKSGMSVNTLREALDEALACGWIEELPAARSNAPSGWRIASPFRRPCQKLTRPPRARVSKSDTALSDPVSKTDTREAYQESTRERAETVSSSDTPPAGTADATRGRDKGTSLKNSRNHHPREGGGGERPDDDDDRICSIFRSVTGRAATSRDRALSVRLEAIPAAELEPWMREVVRRAPSPVHSLAYFVTAYESEQSPADAGATDPIVDDAPPAAPESSASDRERLGRHVAEHLRKFAALNGRDPTRDELREHLADYCLEREIPFDAVEALYPASTPRPGPRLVTAPAEPDTAPPDVASRQRFVKEQLAALRTPPTARPGGARQ